MIKEKKKKTPTYYELSLIVITVQRFQNRTNKQKKKANKAHFTTKPKDGKIMVPGFLEQLDQEVYEKVHLFGQLKLLLTCSAVDCSWLMKIQTKLTPTPGCRIYFPLIEPLILSFYKSRAPIKYIIWNTASLIIILHNYGKGRLIQASH